MLCLKDTNQSLNYVHVHHIQRMMNTAIFMIKTKRNWAKTLESE